MDAPIYQSLAAIVSAIRTCEKRGNMEGAIEKHRERIAKIMESAPSGSGIDSGTTFDEDRSQHDKLVFSCSFHHMDEHGGYDGWTEHEIIVRPSLAFGITLRITGRDRNDIKDYLHEVYEAWLCSPWPLRVSQKSFD